MPNTWEKLIEVSHQETFTKSSFVKPDPGKKGKFILLINEEPQLQYIAWDAAGQCTKSKEYFQGAKKKWNLKVLGPDNSTIEDLMVSNKFFNALAIDVHEFAQEHPEADKVIVNVRGEETGMGNTIAFTHLEELK